MKIVLKTSDEQRREVKDAITEGNIERNEKVWNYLIGTILHESSDRNKFIKKFVGDSIEIPDELEIWCEAQPLPPREKESNTQLDMAFGAIKRRVNTDSGIEFDREQKDAWVCFVEGKLYADCSTQVTNDPLRNQLIRIIENLLCFQGKGDFPEKLFFTLLTPRFFKENDQAKLYGYKMREYKEKENILRDIRASRNEKRERSEWRYPDLSDRLDRLELRWVTYEEILEEEFRFDELDLTDLGKMRKHLIRELRKKRREGLRPSVIKKRV